MPARVFLYLIVLLLTGPSVAAMEGSDFGRALQEMQQSSLASRGRVISRIEATDDPRAEAVLRALLEGRLYTQREDGRLLIAEPAEGGLRVYDPLAGGAGEIVESAKLKRIPVNNALRTQLRAALGRLAIASPDPARRLAAIGDMVKELGPATVQRLRQRLEKEPDRKVRAAIESALALADLDQPDAERRLAAVARLRGNLDSVVRGRLTTAAASDPDERVKQAAARALLAIESRLGLYRFVETAFFGLSLGSVLLLAAIGLAITFGVMGVINMAHGELIMLGAYTTYVMQQILPNHIGTALFLAIPLAFLVSGAVGIAIERGVIRFLYGRPLETLLATFGISLLLQQAVRSIFSPLNRQVTAPGWMQGSMLIDHALSLTVNRLFILGFGIAMFFALLAVLKKTRLGLEVRAVAQNRPMARAMGIRTERVDALTFGLGSGIAGVAGVMLSQLTNVGPNLGQSYIIDSFLVVVFGGVGNLWGTLVGALSLGLADKLLEPVAGAVLSKIIVLLFIIVFIQKRPRGLFPQRGRAAED